MEGRFRSHTGSRGRGGRGQQGAQRYRGLGVVGGPGPDASHLRQQRRNPWDAGRTADKKDRGELAGSDPRVLRCAEQLRHGRA